jgi:hypothetical protein
MASTPGWSQVVESIVVRVTSRRFSGEENEFLDIGPTRITGWGGCNLLSAYASHDNPSEILNHPACGLK